MIRVLLADDEAMIRAGVAAILATDPEIEVVAEVGSGAEALALTRTHHPDVALLDIRMPKMDGIATAAELRGVAPEVAVVILTTFDEDAYVSQALSHGASGFMLKAADPKELIIGVKAVADGAAYLSPRIARRVISQLDNSRLERMATAREHINALTRREREVLTLVGKGQSNHEIGRKLHISEGTVKGHVSTILIRLEAKNRVQAAIIAYEAGLVDD